MVGMAAEEDEKSVLQLTVAEFTVQVRAINPVNRTRPRRVLTVGQDVVVHSHGAQATCKVQFHTRTAYVQPLC
jgi:hypothetical protein